MQVLLKRSQDRGSATVTALIVVGVVAVLLTSLIWRQQIQVRSLESARDRVQAQWLERAVLDFARLVLAEDQRTSQYDHLGETWALPLADGKVADFLKNADVPDEIATVTLQGRLIDAQGLFNLANLWDKNFQNINLAGVQEYSRLLDALGIDSGLAKQTAQGILQMDIPIYDLDGLSKLPIYSPAVMEKIRPYVVVLPNPTAVNVNTALPEVLMAAISGLSRSTANGFIQQRSATPVKSLDQLRALLNMLGAGQGAAVDASLIDVKSQYWIANTEIRLGKSIFINSALIQRSPALLPSGNFTQVIWSRIGKLSVEY